MKNIVRQILIKLGVDGGQAKKDLNAISASLGQLKLAFSAVTAAYGVFKLAQQGAQMMAFARQTGVAAQSVIALSRSFEAAGHNAQEATSFISRLREGVAKTQMGQGDSFIAQLSGMGVRVMDKNGHLRQDADMIGFDAGDKAMEMFHGDRQRAMARLYMMGFSMAQAEQFTNPKGREEYAKHQEQAKIAEEAAKKMSVVWEKFSELKNIIADIAAKPLADLLDALKPLIPTAVALAKAFAALMPLLEPVLKLIEMLAAGIEKLAKYFIGGGKMETGDGGELPEEPYGVNPKSHSGADKPESGKGVLDSIVDFLFPKAQAGIIPPQDRVNTPKSGKGRAYTQNYDSPLLNDREDNIANFIMGGEGDYNIARMKGKTIGKNANSYTVKQIMDMQKRGEMFAAGRYQFTKESGWHDWFKKAGLNPDDKFDSAAQDKLFRYHVNNAGNAAGNLKDYLAGRAPDLDKKARDWLSGQWRSLEYGNTGKTFPDKYARQNLASISWKDFKPGAGSGAQNNATVTVNVDARGNENAKEIASAVSDETKRILHDWQVANAETSTPW